SAMGAQLTENGPSVSSILRNSTCLFSGVPRNFYTPSSPLSALHAAPIHTDACKLYSTREATENSGGEDDEKEEGRGKGGWGGGGATRAHPRANEADLGRSCLSRSCLLLRLLAPR
ncbi:unnamed protein product, partial [Prorocentrum cordatum]